MANAKVSASDVFFGRAAPTERSFRNRIIGLIAMQEIGINILVMPLALSTAALAGAKLTDPRLLPLLVVTFLAMGVAMMTNNIIDAERDKTKWPLKPLATGLISKSEALLCTAIWAVLGIVIAIVVFNRLILALGLLVVCGQPRLLTLSAGQHRVSYVILAFCVSSCGNMEWFLPRDRLNSTPVDFRYSLCSMDTDSVNPTGRIRPNHPRPLHPAPSHYGEGALRSICHRRVFRRCSDLLVCTVIVALRGGIGSTYGGYFNSGKKFGGQ